MPKAGDVIADKYTIEQLIGLGGMGAVFSALHKYTGKRVALKWMLPELAKDGDAVQRFMREAHAAGRITHPNVVDVYDVGQHDESYFLVMEFLQGEPLTSALARRDLTPAEVLSLLVPAMRGVAAAHRQQVVHRDLKPDNIFLAYEEDGVRREAKVLDFGISKIATEDPASLRLTRTGAVVGTPYYMAPEQIRGSHGLDKRADIYAMGVILYEALTGRVPFEADTYGALVLEIATGTAKPLNVLVPTLPAELSRVVLRAMAREISERYADMEALIVALEPFTTSSTGQFARRTQPSIDLEATQISEVNLSDLVPAGQRATQAPHSTTKPHLASTPFAAESTATTRRNAQKSAVGIASFTAAAAALVGGIWFFTREPAANPANGIVTPRVIATPAVVTAPPTVQPRAAAAQPDMNADSDTPRVAVQEAEAIPKGSDPELRAPRAPRLGESSSKSTIRFEPLPTPSSRSKRTAPASREAISAKPAGSHRRAESQGSETPSSSRVSRKAAETQPEAQAQDASSPAHRARSGVLNVNEF